MKTTAFHCDVQDGFNNGVNNCIALDPLFMRPAAGDYSLRGLSPCRERGKPLAWHTTGVLDLAGNPRVMPRSGTVDMGAMEGLPLMSTLMMVR